MLGVRVLGVAGEAGRALNHEARPARFDVSNVLDQPTDAQLAHGRARCRLLVAQPVCRLAQEIAVLVEGLDQLFAL